jgi:cation:H+ antiporter
MLIIGLGTSLPEFFVAHIGAFHKNYTIGIGAVVGSNIANIFLVLGLASFLTKIPLAGKSLKNQLYFNIAVTLLAFGLLQRSSLDYLSVIICILFFIFYIYLLFRDLKKEPKIEQEPFEINLLLEKAKMLSGFFLLYFGGEYLVKSGTELGHIFQIDSYVISVVFVAFGTSFPELMTALIAAKKKKDVDLIIGNIIGSNIFNILFVLGTMGIHKISLPKTDYTYEFLFLIFAGIYFIVINAKKESINKVMGAIFLLMYAKMVNFWI